LEDVQWEILSLDMNYLEHKVREIVRELIKRRQPYWAQHAEDLEKDLESEEELDEDEGKASERADFEKNNHEFGGDDDETFARRCVDLLR
jgi:hypothetical protein